ncbi:hypothetical protein MQH31_00425 [Cryobacterium sp. ZS14-85]|uniref:Response regulatory domain-containing protein n=1 Tax=Cryobacterium zhongshanensis TaxID=2928153 RepID=A0AA41QRT1_9MICO|nr:hypothetical protein [Cryobacterium zhongshanensis]
MIVLTAPRTTEDRIQGLELGADDHVTKPFNPHEVVLRLQAVLHRHGGSRQLSARGGGACRGSARACG